MPEAPLRLVQYVGYAVIPLGDHKLPVVEVLRPHEVDGAKVVDDVKVHRTAVVVGGVVPAAGHLNALAVLPVSIVAYYVEPLHLLGKVALFWREASANHLRVAFASRPIGKVRSLGHAAALVVESAHVYAKGRLCRIGRNAEALAAPDARHLHKVCPLVRDGREVHLVSHFASEGNALLGDAVIHAEARRLGAVVRHLAGRGVHYLPTRHRRLGQPRAEDRPQPRADVGEFRSPRQIANLVHLEERTRLLGVARNRGGLIAPTEDGVDYARLGAGRERIDESVRHRPVARLGFKRYACVGVVSLVYARVRIEEPQQRSRDNRPMHLWSQEYRSMRVLRYSSWASIHDWKSSPRSPF